MSILKGQTNINSIYKGGTPITKVYIGDRVLFQIGGDYYELIDDITISVATTSVTLSGFTATKEDSLVLVSDFNNTSGDGSNYELYFNNNQTGTNYWLQRISVDGATVSGVRANTNLISSAFSGMKSFNVTDIKLTNDGYGTFDINNTLKYTPSPSTELDIYDAVVSTTFTMASITQLDIVAQIANAIGIGSRFQLYRRIA